MPIVQGQQVPNTPYKYIHIEDFTAGMYNYSESSTSKSLSPGPAFSAIPSRTWGCIGLPEGGLGPMPRLVQTYTYLGAFPAVTNNKLYVAMMTANPASTGYATEIILAVQGYHKPVSGTQTFYYYTYVLYNKITTFNTWHRIVSVVKNAGSGKTQSTTIWGSPYPFWTRSQIKTTGYVPALPELVWPSWNPSTPTGHTGNIWMWPYPSLQSTGHRGTWTTQAYTLLRGAKAVTTGSAAGQVFGFNGRIVSLPIHYDIFPGAYLFTNDYVQFTTWTNYPTRANMRKTLTSFEPENPFGYGAIGSISNGELFMVKKYGGALILQGDLITYSTTILPGVMPTGNFYGRGQSSSDGFFYCVQYDGAYVWNGGNTSTKISNKISDTFYVVNTTVAKKIGTNFGFFVMRFANLMVFSNNYVYDTDTKSWWSLYPNNTQTITTSIVKTTYVKPKSFFHFAQGVTWQTLWASPLSITTTTKKIAYKFTMTKPAAFWQWTSNPITLTTNEGSVVDVRQIILRVAPSVTKTQTPNHHGALEIRVGTLAQIVAGTAWSWTSNFGNVPVEHVDTIRLNCSALGLQTMCIQLIGKGYNGTIFPTQGYAAPTVFSIDIGYQERAPIHAG
jgi:hypothetical protein